MKGSSSTNAVLLVIVISIVLGFLLSNGAGSLEDSTRDDAKGTLKLRGLNILLHQER